MAYLARFIRIAASAGLIAYGLYGQTSLTSGVTVPFYTTGANLIGTTGWTISVPSSPVELEVAVEVTPPYPGVDVLVRCGTPITNVNGAFTYDTAAQTDGNGSAVAFLALPNGAGGNCYVGVPSAAPMGGRITASIHPFPSGTQVTVPSLAQLYLAGQPAGTKFGTSSAPSNSPVQVPAPITPGQGLSMIASGSVNGTGPEGRVSTILPAPVLATTNGPDLASQFGGPALTGMFGISDAYIPANALIGVFLGSTINPSAPLALGYLPGDLQNAPVVQPLLQQVFYIGNGVTPAGIPRVFVAPAGATRLFVASAAGGDAATGSFSVSVSSAPVPTSAMKPANPVVIPALADLYLLDQPNGTAIPATNPFGRLSGFASAIAPYSTPVQVSVPLTPGQTLHFSALPVGTNMWPLLTQTGGLGASSDAASFGLSGITLGAGLIGVFVGDTLNNKVTPAAPDYGDSIPTQVQKPALQQVFYAGGAPGTVLSGGGSSATFDYGADVVVPAGATRLFVAHSGGGLASVATLGPLVASVAPVVPSAPSINAGGIVTNAGFAPGPVAPGSMVAIFGQNFGPLTYPSGLPLPTTLGGTQVYFNATPAPLFYVSPTQIVAQVPYEAAFWAITGSVGKSSALVTVVTNGVASQGQAVSIASVGAGIFTASTGDPIITDAATGALVNASTPVARGDTLIIWTTGLGSTVYDPATGGPAPELASPTLLPLYFTLKNTSTGAVSIVAAQYAGLAPDFVALDQINAQIPAATAPGTYVLQLVTPGFTSALPYPIAVK